MKKKLTTEELREILHYAPETGYFFWKQRPHIRSASVAGDRAGSVASTGYIQIQLYRQNFLAHRLAWMHFYGFCPESQIDHINGNRSDNRITNLRAATAQQNQHNRRSASRNSRAGLLGVTTLKNGRFRSVIGLGGKQKVLGQFDTPEQAHAAYLKAKAELHPFSTITERAP